MGSIYRDIMKRFAVGDSVSITRSGQLFGHVGQVYNIRKDGLLVLELDEGGLLVIEPNYVRKLPRS